jgi:septum site-determining protein MinC
MTVARRSDAPPPGDSKAFKLRGGSYTLLVLRLIDLKNPNFFQWLLNKIAQAPNLYRHAPVVLDLEGLAGPGPFNFAELGRRLRQHKLIPVGVQNGTEEQNQGAIDAGLSVIPMWRAVQPVQQPTATTRPEKRPAEPLPKPSTPPVQKDGGTTLVTQPIRSGRQVYGQDGDLVVLSTVGAGAELLADGNIHVYGALRGRALAGVSGNTSARIFCRSLQAELVSIAGHWLVREDMDDHLIGRTVQVYLKGDLLVIEPMS